MFQFNIEEAIATIKANPNPNEVQAQLDQTRKEVTAMGHDLSQVSDETILTMNITGSGMIEHLVQQGHTISDLSIMEIGQLTMMFLEAKKTYSLAQEQLEVKATLANMLGSEMADELTNFFAIRGKVLHKM
jgi:hypothetical protein